MYRNPFLNAAITFLEPLPVGIVVTLVCAGVLRRKRKPEAEPTLTAVHQPSSHAR